MFEENVENRNDFCSKAVLDEIDKGWQRVTRKGRCNADIGMHLLQFRSAWARANVTHVSEVGVRYGVATFAFLAAWKEKYL